MNSRAVRIGIALGFGALVWLALVAAVFRGTPRTEDPAEAKSWFQELSAVSRQVSQAVGPSVVRIEVDRRPSVDDPELTQLFGGAIPTATQGSGVVVSDQGHVLTNYHVVASADRIRVFAGSESYTAKQVGADALTDLALLQVEKLAIPAIRWGDSDQVAAGDFTWAIGNPYGLQRSVTFGIISAVDRDTVASSPFQNFLQTDAALNPGSSGGPLVNVNAEIIGINTAIVGQSFRGISFAIPSNTARDVLAHLRESGKVRRGWIGVRLDDLSSDPTRALDAGHSQGAVVGALSGDAGDQTPARAAGLRPDDVIVRWGDIPVVSAVQLGRQVAQTAIGAIIPVRVIRQGAPLTLDMTVAERPN